jgi:UDP-N-acetylglucosamine pyrophosphorylase
LVSTRHFSGGGSKLIAVSASNAKFSIQFLDSELKLYFNTSFNSYFSSSYFLGFPYTAAIKIQVMLFSQILEYEYRMFKKLCFLETYRE